MINNVATRMGGFSLSVFFPPGKKKKKYFLYFPGGSFSLLLVPCGNFHVISRPKSNCSSPCGLRTAFLFRRDWGFFCVVVFRLKL